jgi:hypothetical protein
VKILLVYPPIFRAADIYSTPIPLGLLQVGGYLKSQGHEVRVLNLELGGSLRTVSIRQLRDAYAKNNPVNYINDNQADFRVRFRAVVTDYKPDLIGFSCATEQLDATEILTGDARAILPEVQIEYGGYHKTFSLWSDNIGREALNVDPDLELLADQNPPESFGSILTSHGCPHECTFCGSPKRYNRRLTLYPIETVKRRILLAEKLGADRIHLMDDSITLRHSRAIEIADMMNEIALPWRTQTRVDDLGRHPELADYFKERGCTQLTFGVESGSPRMLEITKKKITPDQVLRAVEILNNAEIPYTANFMIGYPGETDDDIELTMKLIRQMAPRRVLAGSVVPYPSTALHDENPEFIKSAQAWPLCRWSPFDPAFLCDEDGNRISGPSRSAIRAFYELIESVNDHTPTPGTFSTVSETK